MQLLRISETRHLHQDAIVALALDRAARPGPSSLTRSLDDLDRLIDHLADALEDRRLGHA